MTTDPGDLVLDPTSGSGTTAYVAEQWGRRWITIDSSRVALFIARQRLLTASYPYYKIKGKGARRATVWVWRTPRSACSFARLDEAASGCSEQAAGPYG
jgi:adenine-specific DNA-methyltransferase